MAVEAALAYKNVKQKRERIEAIQESLNDPNLKSEEKDKEEGTLIIHWEDFDIRNEKTNVIVDHVDHMWVKFIFSAYSYDTKWWRSDKNPAKKTYIHPHVSESASSFCSGNYPQGQLDLKQI